jgi:hypothetical protein
LFEENNFVPSPRQIYCIEALHDDDAFRFHQHKEKLEIGTSAAGRHGATNGFLWNARSGLRRLQKIQNGASTVLAKDTTPYTTGTKLQRVRP